MEGGDERGGNCAFRFVYRRPVCHEAGLHPNCSVPSLAREIDCGLHCGFNTIHKRRMQDGGSALMEGEVKSLKEKCMNAVKAMLLSLGNLLD